MPSAPERSTDVASRRPYGRLQQRILEFVLKHGSRFNVRVYRGSGGRLGPRFPFGLRALLLTTTGRRSGLARTVALIYLADGDDVVVVASTGGLPHHPAWYLNLTANPEVSIQVGRDTHTYVARTARGDEREGLWRRLLVMYPYYATYQAKAQREIPVVVCTPT